MSGSKYCAKCLRGICVCGARRVQRAKTISDDFDELRVTLGARSIGPVSLVREANREIIALRGRLREAGKR